ncbi:MAG: hypothetical protein Athens071426_417 [Parcubacteria group bacterium Athens0714_26]|nr:MAG: hypothetical protein Athens071426_417 [Parcubacteria group bacterium Athens0714_26]
MKIHLTGEQKKELATSLIDMSSLDVGMAFGFNKFYKTDISIKQAVFNCWKEIKANHSLYGLSDDTVTFIERAILAKRAGKLKALIKETDIDLSDKKEAANISSDKCWILWNRKMDYLLNNSNALKNVPLSQLAIFLGTIFDKTRLIKGEATEHIALRAKIDEGLSAKQILEEVMKRRVIEEK